MVPLSGRHERETAQLDEGLTMKLYAICLVVLALAWSAVAGMQTVAVDPGHRECPANVNQRAVPASQIQPVLSRI